MNFSTTTSIDRRLTNYPIVAPLSLVCVIIAVGLSLFILIVVLLSKKLHTVTHMLICNTCLASILYCVVQCNNYIYLLFIDWNTDNHSCRWRGYFAYVAIVAVIYSYLLQAISRFFIVILSTKFRWLMTIRTHLYMMLIGWTVVLSVPSPALITTDIYFRPGFLCWVPMKSIQHVAYTIIAYYLAPVMLIIAIYIFIYVRIRTSAVAQFVRRRQKRDLEVFRNIVILLGIYTLGAIPVLLYVLTNIELFYAMGMVSVSLTVSMEKLTSLFLDREIRTLLKRSISRRRIQVKPIVAVNNLHLYH